MKKMDYKKMKVDALAGKENFVDQLMTLKEQELYAHKILDYLKKCITEVSRKKDDGVDVSKEEIYSLRRLVVGSEVFIQDCQCSIQELEMMRKLSETMDSNKLEKVSFSEKRVIRSSVEDLKKICSRKVLDKKRELEQIRIDSNPSVNVSKILLEEGNLIEAYVNYCIDAKSQGTINDGFDYIEKKFDKLIAAQKGYDEQIKLSGGKILKEEFNFKK